MVVWLGSSGGTWKSDKCALPSLERLELPSGGDCRPVGAQRTMLRWKLIPLVFVLHVDATLFRLACLVQLRYRPMFVFRAKQLPPSLPNIHTCDGKSMISSLVTFGCVCASLIFDPRPLPRARALSETLENLKAPRGMLCCEQEPTVMHLQDAVGASFPLSPGCQPQHFATLMGAS